MNLKYYLRGLGLGMLVTALILGLSGNKKETMTDAEIKARALELGMIENTVLMEREEQEDATPDVPLFEKLEEEQEMGENGGEPEKKAEEAMSGKTVQAVQSEMPKESEMEQSGEEEQADEAETVQPEEETEKTAGRPEPGSEENDAEAERTSQTAQDGAQIIGGGTDQTIILTVSHGDSSYSVAQKLFDMKIIPSVAEYDEFLCQNGYDRGIRAGTYEIKAGTSPEQIARMINGK